MCDLHVCFAVLMLIMQSGRTSIFDLDFADNTEGNEPNSEDSAVYVASSGPSLQFLAGGGQCGIFIITFEI